MPHLLAKIGQYAIIKNENNQILVLERKRSKEWSLPGGRLEANDRDPIVALRREVKEELGLEIRNCQAFDVSIIKDKYQIKYCVYFLVEAKNLSKLKISPEHSSYKWIDAKVAKGMKFEDKMIRKIISSI